MAVIQCLDESLSLSSCIYIINLSSTDILPAEYGGTNGCLDDLTKFWKREVEASHDWLKLQVQKIEIIFFTK